MREARGPAWTDWLHEHGIVALTGIDTRSLVLHLRERGRDARGRRRGRRLGRRGGRRRPRAARDGRPRARRRGLDARAVRLRPRRARARIAVVDYGCKRSILRRLAAAGAAVTVFPHDADADELAALRRRAPLERPRRPGAARARGRDVRDAARAACRCSASASATSCSRCATGHETFKLPFGHRGANHPVLDRATGRVLVTSQNHGFAVAPTEAREATHVSLYDGTVEGLDFPELAAPLGAVPSGGGAGPARRLADPRELGGGGVRVAAA